MLFPEFGNVEWAYVHSPFSMYDLPKQILVHYPSTCFLIKKEHIHYVCVREAILK